MKAVFFAVVRMVAVVGMMVIFLATANAQVPSSQKPTISKAPAESASSQQAEALPVKTRVHVGPDIQATDAERAAITFTGYDLDVRLAPAQQSIAVRALLKVRNDSEQPLVHLPLQVSSSLEWESVRADHKELLFGLQTINSDADHTGQLREAVVVLLQPLAPGKLLTLDVVYRGTIEETAKRLEAIGTPPDIARRSDWDRISPEFTGLRGFGNVAWYPVSSVPVALGDGAKLFSETGKQKQRQSPATMEMKVSVEYLGTPPNLAVINGHPVAMTAGVETADIPLENSADVLPPNSADVPRIATCKLPPTMLGFAAPSLIVASRIEQADLRSTAPGPTAEGPTMDAYLRAGDQPNIELFLSAMAKVTPLLQQWLGGTQKTPLTLVDLPEPDDTPFETGSVLLRPWVPRPLHSRKSSWRTSWISSWCMRFAHSYFHSPREWLNEGAAYFLGTLWLEKSAGRDVALQSLDTATLALAEPASPADGDGQDLLHATDPIHYRSKAASVLWMLRDLAGDERLSAAMRDYDPAADTNPQYFEHLLERVAGDGSPTKDLKWFFDDWVYSDRGLPDLSIESVYASKSAVAGSYVVAVNLANDGYAAAEVPLTVRSDTKSITERVRIAGRSKITHRMLVQGEPAEVLLNDGSVPEVQSSRHAKSVDQAP